MYLKRKLDDFLLEWKKSADRKPLIVKGARQIGKTESIKHFAVNYENFVNINFVLEKKYKTICEDGYTVQDVIRNISRIDSEKKFIPGKTLILFDEIQDYPEIATSLKSFCIDRQFDVICSGSMLGINYKRIESNSVGYKSEFQMQSMDFEEFLWAMGYGSDVVGDLLSHMRSVTPFNQTDMNVFGSLFMDYCLLGGMPEVVRSFVEKGTFEGTLALQRALIADYKEDIKKYVEGIDKTRVLNVFNSIPVQLAKENKKFQVSKVASGAKFKDYWGCVEWLNDAGMVNLCHCLHTPELPLKGNFEEKKYKIYFKDTGLLVANLDDESQEDLRANRNMNVYKGALYENIVAEILSKQGYELFYYKKENSTLEQDFFVRTKKTLVPVEVKAKAGTAKSLSTLVKSDAYPDITTGIKFSAGNVGFQNNIYTFPYFCVFLLKRYLSGVDF
ncbi:MAG: ATP-binding protein [Fibrobacter sp.]|uniref:ATP-binding protein n=1 Tax=Fibrobacter sp. TaxID=35828 RepID=UPI0025C736DE|nr:ATP-binding protein [Fibrobacter sp.]MBQ3715754.1 ATP-binding protein [Fibrobacter sp.]MBQ7078178.1 ATP-binding protein [Fibrobacter sp.]